MWKVFRPKQASKEIALASLKLCLLALADGVFLQLSFPRSASAAPEQNVSSIWDNREWIRKSYCSRQGCDRKPLQTGRRLGLNANISALLFEVLPVAENTGNPPPFPNLGKGGGSGGYTPVTLPESKTIGAASQGQAAVRRLCYAPLSGSSRLFI